MYSDFLFITLAVFGIAYGLWLAPGFLQSLFG